jgi:hypothetical protein
LVNNKKYRLNIFFQIFFVFLGLGGLYVFGSILFSGQITEIHDFIIIIVVILTCSLGILSPGSSYTFESGKLCFKLFAFNLLVIPYNSIVGVDSYFLMTRWYRIVYMKNSRIRTKNILPLRHMTKFIKEISGKCPSCKFDGKTKRMKNM